MLDSEGLLALYDTPDPERPGRVMPGYDRAHAERTADIVLMVAKELGVAAEYLAPLEVAALLHDIGRVGLEPELFGRLFRTAQAAGIPVRLGELRQRYPQVAEPDAPRFFLELARPALEKAGLAVTPKLLEHIDMRMAFRRRVRLKLQELQPRLKEMGVSVQPWMEALMLYYYYPQVMEGQPPDVKLLAEVMVASENFEAYNNAERARDYYEHGAPRLEAAFQSLGRFLQEGLVSQRVYDALAHLTATGKLDDILRRSRGLAANAPLPREDVEFKDRLSREVGQSRQEDGGQND